MRTLASAKQDFAAVGKLDQGQSMRLLKLEKAFQSMAEDVFDLVLECPDRTAGLRLLLQAKWTFAHAVTHGVALQTEKKSGKKESVDS